MKAHTGQHSTFFPTVHDLISTYSLPGRTEAKLHEVNPLLTLYSFILGCLSQLFNNVTNPDNFISMY